MTPLRRIRSRLEELRRLEELKTRHRREVDALSQQAVGNDALDTASLERAERYGRAVDQLEKVYGGPSPSDWAQVLLLVTAVVLLCIVPVDHVEVDVQLRCEAVGFRPVEDWDWQQDIDLRPDYTLIQGLDGLSIPGHVAPREDADGDMWLKLRNAPGTLGRGHVGGGGHVEILSGEDGAVDLYVRGAPFRAEATFWGRAELSADLGADSGPLHRSFDLDIPLTAILRADGRGAAPVRLSLHPEAPWSGRHIYVDSLSFLQAAPNGSGDLRFVSTILDGTLNISSISQTRTLNPGTFLVLDRPEGVLEQLRIGDTIQITFVGTAKDVKYGSQSHLRSRRPSCMRYIFLNTSDELLAIVAFFLVSFVLYKLRKRLRAIDG